MRYSPYRRLTPLQVLQHQFFDELRDEQVYTKLRKEYQIPDLFNFSSSKELTPNEVVQLVPSWYS
jgi:hypothetical protein